MGILDILYPRYCFGCEQKGRYLCENCSVVNRTAILTCPVCNKGSTNGKTHKSCKSEYSLDGFFSAWSYQGAIRKILISLKYKFAKDVAGEIISALPKILVKISLPKKAILVPIPMHKKRRNWRGFSQTEELGALLASKMGWKYFSDGLIKIKDTKPQVELSKAKRKTNLEGVFKVNPKYNFKGTKAPIIIFDDVWTTGSTVKEAAKVFKAQKVRVVWGLTIARTG